jgi:hypothetical protein
MMYHRNSTLKVSIFLVYLSALLYAIAVVVLLPPLLRAGPAINAGMYRAGAEGPIMGILAILGPVQLVTVLWCGIGGSGSA